jgi:hypothetical protein
MTRVGSGSRSRGANELFLFTHVQKAGGTTVEVIMRRNFGIRHMLVHPRRGWVYERRDLVSDLRLNPLARSICSHWLRPFIDFGRYEGRLVWYTMLRRPLDRYLSHFQYHIERMDVRRSFADWIKDPIQHNLQTRLLAGEQDVEAAKQILVARYRCVGLLERFNESLLLIRHRLGLNGLRVSYERPHNTAASPRTKVAVRAQFESMIDECTERNRLDVELYDFVVRELFPRQVADYGEERLERDVQREFDAHDQTFGDTVRELTNKAYRRAVYVPVARARQELARLRGLPDTRRWG